MNTALAQTDAYKLFHKLAAREGITTVYENYTNRSGRLAQTEDGVVFVGLQYSIKSVLIDLWNDTFFKLPRKDAIKNGKRLFDSVLGNDYDMTHFEALHDLGYLPLLIKALPEGSLVPYGVPPFTMVNTVPGFGWLVGYLETVISTENWPIQTSATTAREYLKNTIAMFNKAGLPHDLVPFMVHDFSFRGMFGRHAAAMSGFAHLTSFAGTDTLSAIEFAEEYYKADCTKELVGVSVPATEHSTTTSFIMTLVEELGISKRDAELMYVRYLFQVVPTGIVSHVCDSYDFWDFIANSLPLLKDEIMARDGKFVVRPDSGDPVKVLCGYKMWESEEPTSLDLGDIWNDGYRAIRQDGVIHTLEVKQQGGELTAYLDREICEYEQKGLIECLWDIFGGTLTELEYKLLDDHIGAIYGDSITTARQVEIHKIMFAKGFVPMAVLGVGSFSYQFVTRDTHGSAIKATWVEKDEKGTEVFKQPKTDSRKNSAKGLLRVEYENGTFVLYDEQTPFQEAQGCLVPVFKNGSLLVEHSLAEIRERVHNTI